jgi:putative N6-adenine-specific DNA methylase
LHQFFAVTGPGIAPYTAQELQRLGLLPADNRPAQPGGQAVAATGDMEHTTRGELVGGVEFAGDRAALYKANLHLRTANRVLLRLGSFAAVGFAELRKRAGRLPWEQYLTRGQPVALRVTCHKSRLYHSDAVAERIAYAIADRLGQAPILRKFDEEADEAPPQLIVVRLLHDHCTISLDSSGELLHRRGYRLATAKAPLRETLAAAILLASGWNPQADPQPPPLLDPFCGSGTIAVEAAQMALQMAAGLSGGEPRRYAFMAWPDFDAKLWDKLLAAAREQHAHRSGQLGGNLRIEASDRDAGAIELAQANALRAGVAAQISFSRKPVSAVTPCCAQGWIVTNPPYGLRVSATSDVRNLYAQLGNVLRAAFSGWRLAALTNDRQLAGQIGLRLDTSLHFVNGGLAVVLARGSV